MVLKRQQFIFVVTLFVVIIFIVLNVYGEDLMEKLYIPVAEKKLLEIENNSNSSGVFHNFTTNFSNQRYITCTFRRPGGLGNQLFRFASLYGISRTIGRQPYFDATNYDQMLELKEIGIIFPTLNEFLQLKSPLPPFVRNYFLGDDCCSFDNPERLLGIEAKYIKISGHYLQSYKYFHKFRNEIQKILQCGPFIKQLVNRFAKNLFKNDTNHKFCVHVRRGDFINSNKLESKKKFVVPAIKFAFNHLKQKLKNSNISILFIGNDHEFYKKLNIHDFGFEKTYTPKCLTRGEDLCLGINYCDSMLLTASASTFGWWISYLMKSKSTIFYNSQIGKTGNNSKDFRDFDVFLPEWIKLTIKNDIAVREDKWWYQRWNQTWNAEHEVLHKVEFRNKIKRQ